ILFIGRRKTYLRRKRLRIIQHQKLNIIIMFNVYQISMDRTNVSKILSSYNIWK
ncbi:hypothetical protein L9F63_020740, partial [Diploptera punctata]